MCEHGTRSLSFTHHHPYSSFIDGHLLSSSRVHSISVVHATLNDGQRREAAYRRLKPEDLRWESTINVWRMATGSSLLKKTGVISYSMVSTPGRGSSMLIKPQPLYQ